MVELKFVKDIREDGYIYFISYIGKKNDKLVAAVKRACRRATFAEWYPREDMIKIVLSFSVDDVDKEHVERFVKLVREELEKVQKEEEYTFYL